MSAPTRLPEPDAALILRMLPQHPWVSPERLARHAAVVGHVVTEDPASGDLLIGGKRLTSLLRSLRRDGYARTRNDGQWVRTPTGTARDEANRAAR